MRKRNLILVIGISMCITLLFMGQARATVFPDPTTSIGGVPVSSQHTDFYSFSLPILGYFANPKANFKLLPQNPFYVDAHMDDIIIATSQDNTPSNPWGSNIAGMDHPYGTPAENTTFAFSTGTYPDPGQVNPLAPSGADTDNTWDIELSALAGYLGGSDLMFFFNHNETGKEDDLYAWGRVRLVDLDGDPANPDIDFFFADAPGIPADPSAGPPAVIPGQYVYAPSDVCIPTPWGVQCLEHNLGTSKSAYAVFSPGLNDYVKNYRTLGHDAYGYDAMQGDFRLAGLNGGYEQLFIQSGHTIIPEPATMLLLGSGLLGLAGVGFKKRRKV